MEPFFLVLPKFFPLDLFQNRSEVVVARTPNSDQFVNRSHGKNSIFGMPRKKGSTHLIAIHRSSFLVIGYFTAIVVGPNKENAMYQSRCFLRALKIF